MSMFPVIYSVLSPEAIITEIIPDYDLPRPVACQYLARGLNDSYLVSTPEHHFILRVYAQGWRTLTDIAYELDYLLHLAAQGAPVSAPIIQRNGKYIREIAAPEGIRYCALFTYAPGEMPDNNNPDHAMLYGNGAAQIHKYSDGAICQSNRSPLSLDYLLDESLTTILPLLAHRIEDSDYLRALADRLRIQVDQLENLEWGFCHGDMTGGNAHIAQNGTITFFDFDFCGKGWRAYDLAVFRWGMGHRSKDPDAAWEAFLKGYFSVRLLAQVDLDATEVFVLVRYIRYLGINTSRGRDIGYGWMNDRFFDHHLGRIRGLEAKCQAFAL